MSKKFKKGDFVIYPSHGLGLIEGYESHDIGGISVELLVVSFEKERMTLKIPVKKAENAGLRALASKKEMKDVLDSFKIKTKPKRTMWSRRAQEYELKINSGDPMSIAEVIRDLYKKNNVTDQSYSERQIYQAAMERFSRELSAIENINQAEAVNKVEDILKDAA